MPLMRPALSPLLMSCYSKQSSDSAIQLSWSASPRDLNEGLLKAEQQQPIPDPGMTSTRTSMKGQAQRRNSGSPPGEPPGLILSCGRASLHSPIRQEDEIPAGESNPELNSSTVPRSDNDQ
jgi:hypothetical protein